MRTIRNRVFGTPLNLSTHTNTYTDVDIGICLRDTRKKNRYIIEQFVKKLTKLYNVTEDYLLGLDK